MCGTHVCVERLTIAGINTLKPATFTLLGCFLFFFGIALSIPGAFGFKLLGLVVAQLFGSCRSQAFALKTTVFDAATKTKTFLLSALFI